MNTSNPYAPPRAEVRDVADPNAGAELAGRGIRLVAAIVDGIIFGVMVYVPLVMAGAFSGPSGDVNTDALMGIGGILSCVGLAVWAIITIRFVSANGQSIAKKMFGIKVVRSDGSKASLGRIFWLRNVVNGLLGIIPLYGLVEVLFIFGERRQCLHDKIADTIVVTA